MKTQKLNSKRAGAILAGSVIAILNSGCGLSGFAPAPMDFSAEKVFACPAGNTSSECAGAAHGSLLQPGSATGSITDTGGGASGSIPAGGGANGSIATGGDASGIISSILGGSASGSLPTSGMSGANGSLPTGGNSASSSFPTGGSMAGGNLPTDGSNASGNFPTGGSTAGSNLPTGGSNAGSNLPTGGNIAAGHLPTGIPGVNSTPTYTMTGSQLTINPTMVCGPNVATSSQSFLKTVTGVKAVLYSIQQGEGGEVVQSWDSSSQQTALLSELKQFKPFSLALNQPLAAGDYSLVVYDAQRVSAPYTYDWTQGQTAVAPIQDSVTHNIIPGTNFTVYSDGSIGSMFQFQVLYSTEDDPACADAMSIDPLVIRVADTDEPLLMSSVVNGVMFDILGASAQHQPRQTSWIQTPSYMFLVMPKNGQVTGIDQMFGNGSTGPDGKLASNGFEALAKFDSNHDGVIDARDAVFSHLRLWSDVNHDGIAQASELFTLDQMGIVSLALNYDPSFKEVDQFGNAAQLKSTAEKASGGAYLLFDLWLQVQQ